MARNYTLTQTGAEVQSDLDKIEGAKIEGGTITIGGVSITPATAAELTRVDNKATDALSNSSTAAQMAASAQIDAANALRLANSIPVVKGDGEHAARQEGEDSTNHPYAKGARSIALGRRTVALGDNSHTEGNSSNVAPASVTAATDNEAIKQAWNTSKFSLAKGQNAHTEGNNTLALANHTHAEGNQTVAEGQQSHTEGYLTETKNQSEHAEGRANKSNKASDTFGDAGNTIHSVGIGANAGNRKNAFEIMQSGDAFLLGVGGYDGTNPGGADDIAQVLASKQDAISDLNDIRSGAAAGATAVQPSQMQTALEDKQDTLVSGQNLKTINGNSLLGEGDIEIESGDEAVWGNISGTLADQADLASALGAKYEKPSGGIPAGDIAPGVIPDVSQFVTKSVNDLVNYYTKSQTYTRDEVAALIGAIQQFHYEIVATLPASGESNVLYLLGPAGTGADKYEEYIYANSTWTKIGDTSISLEGYVTTQMLNTALADYLSINDVVQAQELSIDSTPTANSANLVTSGGVYAAIPTIESLTTAEIDTIWNNAS